MANCYLLYIDVLGFSQLVSESSEKIHDLYEVIASLNIHRHPSFRAIVFSDTILIYNLEGGDTQQDRGYLVMYLCEFAQDLQHRLTGRNLFFRAVLVRGEFTHYDLNSLPCFFGPALVQAYKDEKEIKAIGLFMETEITRDCVVFKTVRFNEKYSFVFVTQHLHTIEYTYGAKFPISRFLIEETELIYLLVPEILYLKALTSMSLSHGDEGVRQKHANTLALFKAHYPKTVHLLEITNFSLEAICPGAKWDEVLAQFPETFSFAIESRTDY